MFIIIDWNIQHNEVYYTLFFQVPSQIQISKVIFKNIRGTSKTKDGVVLICSKSFPCDAIELNNVALTFNGAPVNAKCVNVKPILTGPTPNCTTTAAAV